MMKRKLEIVTVIIIAFVFLMGCAQTQEIAKTKTAKGAAIGAAAGTLAGAVIGHQSGHKGGGAVIGGIAGATVGGVIGYKLDKQAKELEQIPNTTVERQEDRLVVTMSEAILFDVNSSAMKSGAQATLRQMADVMIRYPDSNIMVKGHTDSTGSEQYNQDLSERRAKSVSNFLIATGVSAPRITAIGFGETMPIASNSTPQGRESNRRVEVEIKPKEQPPS